MKVAQVVHFRVKPDSWDDVLDLVARWQQEHLADQDGVVDTFIWREMHDKNNGTALVFCNSEEDLNRFSADPVTLTFFEAAKSFLVEEPNYFHVEVTTADILKMRHLQ